MLIRVEIITEKTNPMAFSEPVSIRVYLPWAWQGHVVPLNLKSVKNFQKLSKTFKKSQKTVPIREKPYQKIEKTCVYLRSSAVNFKKQSQFEGGENDVNA